MHLRFSTILGAAVVLSGVLVNSVPAVAPPCYDTTYPLAKRVTCVAAEKSTEEKLLKLRRGTTRPADTSSNDLSSGIDEEADDFADLAETDIVRVEDQHAGKALQYQAEWRSVCDGVHAYIESREATDRGRTAIGYAMMEFLDVARTKYPGDRWPRKQRDWYPVCEWIAENAFLLTSGQMADLNRFVDTIKARLHQAGGRQGVVRI